MLKTDYVSKPIFIKNFWAAFTRVLGPRHVIQELKHCDFSPIGKPTGAIRVASMTFFNHHHHHHHHHHAPHPLPPSQNVSWTTSVPPKKCVLPRLQPFTTIPPPHHLIHPRAQAEQPGEDGAAVRRKLKEEREISDPPPPTPPAASASSDPPPPPLSVEAPFKYAVLDNHKEQTGNFRVEPPGLFRGRGEHPRMGQLKRRIAPEDITMSCGLSAVPPICEIPGRGWRDLVHNVESATFCHLSSLVRGLCS